MAGIMQFLGRSDVRDVGLGVITGVALGTFVSSWVHRSGGQQASAESRGPSSNDANEQAEATGGNTVVTI